MKCNQHAKGQKGWDLPLDAIRTKASNGPVAPLKYALRLQRCKGRFLRIADFAEIRIETPPR